MNHLIDCSSFDKAIGSVSKLLSVDVNEFNKFLSSLEDYYAEHVTKEYVYERVTEKYLVVGKEFQAVWFHGTRSYDAESFYKYGILTKSEAKEILLVRLRKLSSGLQRVGDLPFKMSIAMKKTPNDEGPFASLIKEMAVYVPKDCHNYTECPELVEDLSAIMLGENYRQLVDRFRAETSSYIVAFKDAAGVYELQHAIWYIYLRIKKINLREEGGAEKCYFSAANRNIMPTEILFVEEV